MAKGTVPPPKGKPHLKGQTRQQQVWVQKTAELGNPTKAAKVAYPVAKYPEQQAYDNMRKPYLRVALMREMEIQGITEGLLFEKIRDGLDATKVQTSPTEPDRDVVDYPTRLKYVQECNKLRDAYPDKQIHVTKQTANINLYAELSDAQLKKHKASLLKEISQLQAG